MKKIVCLIATIIALVIAAGIYRFNFTNDDIYVVKAEGETSSFKEGDNNVMLTLFGLQTDNYWRIQLPDSDVKVVLTELRDDHDSHVAVGKYQDGEEYGLISLVYANITTLNLGDISEQFTFAAPFVVSNQGSGVFWYIGLFQLNLTTAEIKQLDTFFLGDRIKLGELRTDEPFDVTSNLYVKYLKHNESQSMAEKPNETVEQYIKVAIGGFSE